MGTAVESLYSAVAGDGPPLFFPNPDVPAVFNFDQGLAAQESFPKEDLVRLTREVLERDGPDVLDYFDPKTGYEELVYGYRGLRERLADRIRRTQGRDVGPMGIILTSGSVQSIALAVAGYVNPGDVVIVEAASFPYALRYMGMAGGDVRTVPVDDEGMVVEAIEPLIEKIKAEGKTVKLVYTIPTFQVPTNTEMPTRRRQALLALAERHGFVIVEDNVYGDLRFAGDELPTLFTLDKSGLVIQCSSFSKTIAPGLRLGWMVGEPKAIGALAAVRQDLGVGQWLARVLDEYMLQGLLEPHLASLKPLYRSKADTAVKALRKHCGAYVKFREPQGSFYLWLEIDDRVDWKRAAKMAEQEGIFFRPGERFMGESDGRQFLRLAYSHVSEQVIADGIAKLGEILRACARN